MKINWFTVIAQVINFVVLVWLLKRFLYKPIINAIDEREKKIAGQLKDADDKKEAAIKQEDDFTKKNSDFDQQKKELMERAVADANTQRQRLFDEAKDAANKLSAKLEAASKEREQTEKLQIAQKAQKEVFAIARKALTVIASESLEEQSIGTFIKRLNDLKDDEKKKFTEAFNSNANMPAATRVPILIRSAFELPVKQQQDISKSIDAVLGMKAPLQFKTDPGIISGIELTTNGYKLAWSFSEYLDSLEKNISGTMKEKTTTDQVNKTIPVKKTDLGKKAEPVT